MTLEQIIEEAVKESEEIIERLVCASYDAPNNLHITSKELMIEKGKEVFESFLTSTITKSVERVLEEVKISEDEYCLCDQCKSCGRNYAVACVRQQQKYKSLMGKE